MLSASKTLTVLFPPPKKRKMKGKSQKDKGAISLFFRVLKVLFPPPKKQQAKKRKKQDANESAFIKKTLIGLFPKLKRSSKTQLSPVEEIPEDQSLEMYVRNEDIQSTEHNQASKTHLVPISFFIRLNKLLLGTIIISFCFLMVLVFEHMSLYPLVETQYNYAEIIGPEHNFVNVIHTKHLGNENLVENLIRKYVVEREQILKKPSRIVEKFSSPEVYSQYFKILQIIAEKDIRSKLRRHIKIIRYQKIEGKIRQMEVEFTDLLKKPGKKDPLILKSIWLINIKFDFSDAVRRFDQVVINPAGLMISRYAIKKIS
jgi:type IV secretory pathway component VirB8